MHQCIQRTWHGRVPIEKADRYLQLMKEVAIPDYRAVDGNLGAACALRPEGEVMHVYMFSWWVGIEAVRQFAGDAIDVAKYYAFDDDFLLEKEALVLHADWYGLMDVSASR